MIRFFRKVFEKPILLLLAVNIMAGLFIFRDYGLSWDEPLFYDYGNALGYAYSPQEWLSGHFDLERSYGASGDDHKTRGPAYLLLARGPVHLLETLGLDMASAWHLVNFLFFQLSVYFLYRLATRWMKPYPAASAAALFAWQPILWGHALINPKDIPFLVFFLGAVCFGFEMIDSDPKGFAKPLGSALLAAFFLGIATSIRVLGPLAGTLVGVYALTRLRSSEALKRLAVYAVLALLVAFITWPTAFEDLPVADASVDYLISNGVVNLAPDKPRVFAEIARVLRPGGELYLADVVVERELSLPVRADADLWAACVGGAVTEPELLALAAAAGLADGRIVRDFDCFRLTSLERKLGGRLQVSAVAFHARKPRAPRQERQP